MTQPLRHFSQAASFRRRLLQWGHPLHSEDPLVRL